ETAAAIVLSTPAGLVALSDERRARCPSSPRVAAPAAIGPAQSCDPISCILSVHPLSLNSRWPAVYPILTQWDRARFYVILSRFDTEQDRSSVKSTRFRPCHRCCRGGRNQSRTLQSPGI